MKCFECEGTGELIDYIDYQIANKYECFECAGKGKYSIWHFVCSKFWRDIAPVWFVEWLIDVHLWLHKESDND